jgi:hypothetical protein
MLDAINGWLYLLQTRSVYKIGRTAQQNPQHRLVLYGADRSVLLTVRVGDHKTAEAEAINLFRSLFQLHCGREYFEGNPEEMIDVLLRVAKRYPVRESLDPGSRKREVRAQELVRDLAAGSVALSPYGTVCELSDEEYNSLLDTSDELAAWDALRMIRYMFDKLILSPDFTPYECAALWPFYLRHCDDIHCKFQRIRREYCDPQHDGVYSRYLQQLKSTLGLTIGTQELGTEVTRETLLQLKSVWPTADARARVLESFGCHQQGERTEWSVKLAAGFVNKVLLQHGFTQLGAQRVRSRQGGKELDVGFYRVVVAKLRQRKSGRGTGGEDEGLETEPEMEGERSLASLNPHEILIRAVKLQVERRRD